MLLQVMNLGVMRPTRRKLTRLRMLLGVGSMRRLSSTVLRVSTLNHMRLCRRKSML